MHIRMLLSPLTFLKLFSHQSCPLAGVPSGLCCRYAILEFRRSLANFDARFSPVQRRCAHTSTHNVRNFPSDPSPVWGCQFEAQTRRQHWSALCAVAVIVVDDVIHLSISFRSVKLRCGIQWFNRQFAIGWNDLPLCPRRPSDSLVGARARWRLPSPRQHPCCIFANPTNVSPPWGLNGDSYEAARLASIH